MRPGIVGSRVETIVSLLMTIVEAAERGDRGNAQQDKFWQRSLRQILRNGVEVCIAARGEVTMKMLHDVITSAPRTHGEVHDKEWQAASACYRLIEEAERERQKRAGAKRFRAGRASISCGNSPTCRTTRAARSSPPTASWPTCCCAGTWRTCSTARRRSFPISLSTARLSCSTCRPRSTGQAGVYVQSAFTYLWQTACEQRDVKINPRPVFWFVDEAHELVCNYTPEFLATARSARVASVLISQNKPNYLAAMGGEAGRHRVDAFLGNTGTKIFHANGDPETNRWASDTISEEIQTRTNWHGTMEAGQGRGGGSEAPGKKVLPSEFTALKKGGPQNGFMTDCIVYQTGASFEANSGEPWLRTSFRQQIPGVTMPEDGRAESQVVKHGAGQPGDK